MSTLPYVENGKLYRPNGQVICGVGPQTGWFDWLGRRQSFRYRGVNGTHCTVICERRKTKTNRVYWYWLAHRKINGKLRRVYLGKPENMTLSKLEAAAGKLARLNFFDAKQQQSHNREAVNGG